jgi:hypothetical protein
MSAAGRGTCSAAYALNGQTRVIGGRNIAWSRLTGLSRMRTAANRRRLTLMPLRERAGDARAGVPFYRPRMAARISLAS